MGAYKGEIAIAKTGDGYYLPHVTAITFIDADSFLDLAQVMMDANREAAIKAFGSALLNGSKTNDLTANSSADSD